TSALDRAQVERFFAIIRDLKQQGRAMIFISHRMDEITAIGDRVTVIRDGRTVGTWRLDETDAASIIAHMVGEPSSPASLGRCPEGAEGSQRDPGHSDHVGSPSGLRPPPPTALGEGIALSVRGLAGQGFEAVAFDLHRGEILGFGGLHGQGQSAVLRTLFGALPRSAGDVTRGDTSLPLRTPREAIRRGIAYVSGDRRRDGVIQGRPIIENLTPIHYLRRRLVLARPSVLQQKAQAAVAALNTKFAGFAHAIDSLSGGNQQKVVIARWLIDRPDVLLLDDPTKGIDLSAKADLFALIRALARDGLAIVLYSSEDAELLGNADRILVFNGGRIRRELTGAERTRYNLYHAAYEAA
ncbi:MAG TPA: ATP-binding cassette domain-containing protein, partial [Vineibacter sp.]|nr:ATP-binding cassette domain-containing protein [Vineibacter sp.]